MVTGSNDDAGWMEESVATWARQFRRGKASDTSPSFVLSWVEERKRDKASGRWRLNNVQDHNDENNLVVASLIYLAAAGGGVVAFQCLKSCGMAGACPSPVVADSCQTLRSPD
jgi:hypothetical protein